MANKLHDNLLIKRITKNSAYVRLRKLFPMAEPTYIDDRDKLSNAEIIRIQWPDHIKKPKFGLIQDYGPYPRWTKNRRFLENNGFEYEIFNIHAKDWLEKAQSLDVIVGFISSELWDLQEMRDKYFFLEKYLQKRTYPSPDHIRLYEDKKLEAYICQCFSLPFADTHISHDKQDALRMAEKLSYPVVSKVVPGSGSAGVELVRNMAQARQIIDQAFSPNGRTTHMSVFRQKNYVYFQDFVPNDGYDIRIMVVDNWVFGYFRKTPEGDFRASGMNLVEKRALPGEAMQIALRLNAVVKSPLLVVDLVHGLDGKYHIIEFSPICQMEFPEQLHVDGIPGVYIFDPDGTFRFEKGKYWVHELALREFLIKDYLPALP